MNGGLSQLWNYSLTRRNAGDTSEGGKNACYGLMFGQSSFAQWTVVKESAVLNVSDLVQTEDALKLFAPMGCGFLTGAGAVTSSARATKTDILVVMGIGGVGLSSIMVGGKTVAHCEIVDLY